MGGGALIGHQDRDLVRSRLDAYAHGGAGWGVPDGVVDEVRHGPPHRGCVDPADCGRRPGHGEVDPPGGGGHARLLGQFAEHDHQVGGAPADRAGPAPCLHEQLVDDPVQPVGCGPGAFQPAPVDIDSGRRVGEEDLGVGQQHRQRYAQLVAGLLDQPPLRLRWPCHDQERSHGQKRSCGPGSQVSAHARGR